MMLLNKTIRLFLDGIGRREEYEFYLSKFQSADTACFALLVPDLESLDQGAEAFAFDLHFLLSLGLKPAVVLCGSDAEAKWTLLKNNPMFEKTELSDIGKNKDTVPVFFQTLENLLGAGSACFQAVGKRVHFIRASGGFEVDYYYTRKQNRIELSQEDQALADTAAALLVARPGTHISVTSPMNLLEEIFTVKGAGTLFRKGSVILCPDPEKADKTKLIQLLRDSFKKEPKAGVLDQVSRVYVEENYRGAVLLEEHPEGLYLSKFAVGPEARGEGLAQELWDEVCQNHSSFFWRSRTGNPVNAWYDRQADGYHTAGGWMVFWRGIPPDSLPALIAFCQNREPDFLTE